MVFGANTSEEGELFSTEDMSITGKERQGHFLKMKRKEPKGTSSGIIRELHQAGGKEDEGRHDIKSGG